MKIFYVNKNAAFKKCGKLALLVLAFCVFIELCSSKNPVISAFRAWAPLSGRVIVLDPGHGGIDGGTNTEGILEKDINLEVALVLRKLLEKNGVNVIMTRTTDIALDGLNNDSSSRHKRDLLARANIINKASPDNFISIHVNADRRSSKVRGPMVFYYRKSEESKKLAEVLQKSIEDAYRNFGQKIPSRRPLANSSLFLLCNTRVPGVIIEMGFLSSPDDKNLLVSKEFQRAIAEAIVQGLKEYF